MNSRGIKVVVVDDEDDFRQLMAYWLENKGYAVFTAPDGENAVKLVKEKNPDIVFTDLRMPVMDGAETIRVIRKFNKDIPIIVISAYVDDPKMKEVTSYGISGVFLKTKDFSEGLILLEAALRTHKKLKE